MKKIYILLVLFLFVSSLSACDFLEDNGFIDKEDLQLMTDCNGEEDYVVIEGVCFPIGDIVSEYVNIYDSSSEVRNIGSVELMTDFVADLSGSTGLAVVNREIFEDSLTEQVNLAGEENTDTENIIVKLTEDGFFEEVSFSDDMGYSVEITSNPLALEVFGEFTVVAFEVNLGYDDNYYQDLTQKLYDSLYSGGIYLIHNETGKLFATKTVEYTENHYTDYEDHSRVVTLTVTLNEPVYESVEQLVVDEFGEAVLDEYGNKVYEMVDVPLLDANGDPIVFTEGPILYETIEKQVVEYYEKQVLDENGDPVYDEDGNPVVEIVEEYVFDEFGEPIFEYQEVPVLDEFGNPVYEETFEVEIFIEEHIEIDVTEYSANVTDNPLSQIAQRFVDKIISEYYDWNYYRVSNYHLDSYGFANNENGIFYIEWDYETNNQMLKKLSFDLEFNEIVIEDFLDLSKAGFDSCELIIDPLNNSVICKQWDSNLKIYSETLGLITVPDSENLQPITFPNGELYFFDQQEEYVDELGYSTTTLYTINEDGSLNSNYIELGQRDELCYGECFYGVDVDFYTPDGTKYSDYGWVDLVIENASPIIRKADLELSSVGEFDASRKVCTDPNGCWYETRYELLDEAGDLIMSMSSYGTYFPEDPIPNFVERYVVNDQTVYEYERIWEYEDVVCENEIGCTNQINLVDNNINNYGLWMWQNVIVNQGDKLVQSIEIDEDTTATYVYEKEYNGEVCEIENCDEWVKVVFLDNDGEKIYESSDLMTFALGDTIPLRIEYHITNNTNIIYSAQTCTSQYGCWYSYNTTDGIYFEIVFDQGDVIYQSIDFVESDIVEVLNETITRDVCTEVNGCWYDEITYIIEDDLGDAVYTFTNSANIEYGYAAPFEVRVNINDVTINYQQEGYETNATCIENSCYRGVELFIETTNGDLISLGWGDTNFENGDELYYRVTVNEDSLSSVVDEKVCNDLDGCTVYTQNYRIIDELGNEYQREDYEWQNSLPVYFEYGDLIPNNDQFEAVFLLQNVEYNKMRISVYDFIYNLSNVIVLDENLYLIEGQSWMPGDDNFILSFNEETNRYSVKYTNMYAVLEITEFGDGYIAINDDETAIIQFSYNELASTEDYYYFDVTNLTEGLQVNGVNDLIVDFDGSIYFKGVDNFIQDITGYIDEFGEVHIDTEYVEHEVIRVRPIN